MGGALVSFPGPGPGAGGAVLSEGPGLRKELFVSSKMDSLGGCMETLLLWRCLHQVLGRGAPLGTIHARLGLERGAAGPPGVS